MEEAIFKPPNNSGQILRLQIKQKNTHTKKRKVKTWSPEEDDQLAKLYEDYPKKWGIIASLMQDRNENQCLHRYRRLSQLGAHKKIWSAQEDQTIASLIKKIGKNWKLLAEIIGTKTGKQIRQRFINKLDPKIKNEQWTDEEDKLILKYYTEVGSRWSEISKKIPGRPENKIKNRFYSYIQKNYDIRYIYVDTNSMQDQQQKKNIGKDEENLPDLCNINQKTPLPMCLKIQHEQEESNKKLCLKQISNNQRHIHQNEPEKQSKIKDRLKTRYSRFKQLKQQENFYEEENQNNQFSAKKKKTTKFTQKQNAIKQQQNIPSIKQFQDEFKIVAPEVQPRPCRTQQSQVQGQGQGFHASMVLGEQKDEVFDSNAQIGYKFYLKSLIRVEDVQNIYRSIRDLASNNEIENNENELFYLSHH